MTLTKYTKNFGGPFQGEEDFKECYLAAEVEAWLTIELAKLPGPTKGTAYEVHFKRQMLLSLLAQLENKAKEAQP